MALKFGTSGLRGPVTEMTDEECYYYTKAFLRFYSKLNKTHSVVIAGDYRESTPRILKAVNTAIIDEGYNVINAGFIPTPALINYSIDKKTPGIMITGSHIPEDRNGIKFNLHNGEILKKDEILITEEYKSLNKKEKIILKDLPQVDHSAFYLYLDRYKNFIPESYFKGIKVVIYEHSSILRDILKELLLFWGCNIICFERSERFIAVDTEAVEDVEKLTKVVKENKADLLVSADGDGDRPLVLDSNGEIIRGDILGIITSHFIKAEAISIPISCNSVVEELNLFKKIDKTKIGSPYVIESIYRNSEIYNICAGYEANGGYLLGSDIVINNRKLKKLPTRDAVLPIIATLNLVKEGNFIEKLNYYSKRYTFSGLLKGFDIERSKKVIDDFSLIDKAKIIFKNIFDDSYEIIDVNTLDGLRFYFTNKKIIHLRPSGNAPEFRVYCEDSSIDKAKLLTEKTLEYIKSKY